MYLTCWAVLLASHSSSKQQLAVTGLRINGDDAFAAVGGQSSNPFGSTQKAFGNTSGIAFGQQTGKPVNELLQLSLLVHETCRYARYTLCNLQASQCGRSSSGKKDKFLVISCAAAQSAPVMGGTIGGTMPGPGFSAGSVPGAMTMGGTGGTQQRRKLHPRRPRG